MKLYFFKGRGGPSAVFNNHAKEIKYPYGLFPPGSSFSLVPLPKGHINRNFIINYNGRKYRPKAPQMIRQSNIPQVFKNMKARPYGSLYQFELEPVSNNTRVSGPTPKSFNNNWNKRNTNKAASNRVDEILHLAFQKYKASLPLRNENLNNVRNFYNTRWTKHVMNKWFKSNNVLKGPPKPLYRGIVNKSIVNKNGNYTNKSYSSWTTNYNIAKNYALDRGESNKGYILLLKNSNKPRPYVKYINNVRPTFAGNIESEIILGPNTFKVNIIPVT